MKHVAIYNPETMEILFPETYENEDKGHERKRQFDLECMGRGAPWVPYIGDTPFTFTEPEESKEMIADMVRAQRNQKLAKCDWTQLADSPQKTVDKWLVYRQALRDITKSAGFPDAIKWPEAPIA